MQRMDGRGQCVGGKSGTPSPANMVLMTLWEGFLPPAQTPENPDLSVCIRSINIPALFFLPEYQANGLTPRSWAPHPQVSRSLIWRLPKAGQQSTPSRTLHQQSSELLKGRTSNPIAVFEVSPGEVPPQNTSSPQPLDHESSEIGPGAVTWSDQTISRHTDHHLFPGLQMYHASQEAAVPPDSGAVGPATR